MERFLDRTDRRAAIVRDLGSGEGRVGAEASRDVIENCIAESLDGIEEEEEEEIVECGRNWRRAKEIFN